MHFKLRDEKGFSAMRSFETLYTYSRKIQLCNQNSNNSFHIFLELNNFWEVYVTKHTKVPMMNAECSFYTLLLSSR